MTTKEVKPGTHFWGIISGKMAIFLKDKRGDIYICGGWEGDFKPEQIDFVCVIENPKEKIEILEF